MAVFKIQLSQLSSQYQKLGKALMPAALKGVQRGALRVQSALQILTGQASPASENGAVGAVNTGFFKRAWKTQMLSDGARVYNAAPYAGVIEHGRRAGSKMPPKEAIVRWIQRRMGKSEKEARSLAFVVQRAIARRGLLPRRILSGNTPNLKKIWAEEITKELDKATLGALGGHSP